jgi:hypothetical protein
VNAATPAERAQVADSIEAYAASQAQLIRQADGYPLWQDSSARDAYCARNVS